MYRRCVGRITLVVEVKKTYAILLLTEPNVVKMFLMIASSTTCISWPELVSQILVFLR